MLSRHRFQNEKVKTKINNPWSITFRKIQRTATTTPDGLSKKLLSWNTRSVAPQEMNLPGRLANRRSVKLRNFKAQRHFQCAMCCAFAGRNEQFCHWNNSNKHYTNKFRLWHRGGYGTKKSCRLLSGLLIPVIPVVDLLDNLTVPLLWTQQWPLLAIFLVILF